MGGKDIDSAIEVEKIGKNEFRVITEQSVRGLDYGVTISLVYYQTGDKHRLSKFTEDFKAELISGHYVSVVKAQKKENYTPYIMVAWEPEMCCLCAAIGASDDLALE